MSKTGSVEIQMADILDEVSRNCEGVFKTDSMAVAKETVQKLRNTSPRKKGSYASGWKVGQIKGGRLPTLVVHNATDYQLTHLLENGHEIVNAKGSYGRTRGIKHIKPAAEWAADELPQKITEDLDL